MMTSENTLSLSFPALGSAGTCPQPGPEPEAPLRLHPRGQIWVTAVISR